MAAAAPIPRNRYKVNGVFSSILPPDENTNEMAVDCPASYVATHPPMSGRSTPKGAIDAPPPTPLDGSVVSAQNPNTTTNLKTVAKKAADLPQPPMDFTRINRMRESAKRKKEQRLRDERVRLHMTEAEGAKKIQNLKHTTPESEARDRKIGVENPTFVRDSFINLAGSSTEQPPMTGIEDMFLSVTEISHKLENSGLSKDINFLKQLMQDENFQDALNLHKTVVENTSQFLDESSHPVVSDIQNIVTDVHEDLLYSKLQPCSELRAILSNPHFKGLMLAHDGTANLLQPPSGSNPYENIQVHHSEDEEIIRHVAQYTDKSVRVVRIEKTTEALGATVRCEDDGSVTIGRIISGGIAERSGYFREGDELIQVNGKSMRGLDVNEVGDAISSMNGTLVFVLATPKLANGVNGFHPHEVVKYVRALFDYDAIDDPYLPCRELGLSFQKGDILRIMSTDDPDWWQAYRDEDDDTHLTLAGLIPSQDFQLRRETLRIALAKESKAPENKKSLLCGRKKKDKKRALALYKENDDDDSVQTYEEMALYHQPETRKRPIVLIGPPNVGRHELRQKLVDNDRDRFATPVPVTTREPLEGEREGVDYDYISNEQFDALKASGGFVEYGQFQKTLYGTTIESVKDVINEHKICVLNLHAESLPGLCSSDLKPYIVFVGPPPLDRLRMNMERERKQLREDELRKIIEDARTIERKYAHYFDDTIRNVDINRSYAELLRLINKLDTEPQWVPAAWLENGGPL